VRLQQRHGGLRRVEFPQRAPRLGVPRRAASRPDLPPVFEHKLKRYLKGLHPGKHQEKEPGCRFSWATS
jgi:hypothetical protein